MDQCFLGSGRAEINFLLLVEVLSIQRVEVVSVPEGLSSFKSLDVVVGLFFLVVVLQVSVRHHIVLSQSRKVDLLASYKLKSHT